MNLRDDNQHTVWLPTAMTRDAWRQAPKFTHALRLLMDWDSAPPAWRQAIAADSHDDSQLTASQTLALARQAVRAHALMCESS